VAVSEPELGPDDLAKLPSLEELTADTDITVFLRKGVPESLRNAALRRMWSLDPKIRDFVSEAREYAYDWNTPGGVPGFGGPLPPPEEIERLAARIVGAMKAEAGSFSEPERQSAPLVEASQNRESSSPEREHTSDATLRQEASEPMRMHRADFAPSVEDEAAERFTAMTPFRDKAADAPVAQAGAVAPERPQARRHGGAKPL
jgi:hypothetical protein